MKKLTYGILFGLVLLAAFSIQAADKAVKVDDTSMVQFYQAVGKFYNVPERAVLTVKKKGISDEELAVVFFIADRAGLKPAPVIELRLLHKSWLDITVHFGLSPEIYYVPVNTDPGPPYGKAYGYFKKHPRNEWKSIELSDAEIVNLSNLRMVSKLYGVSADDVIAWRCAGNHFAQVNLSAKQRHEQAKAEAKAAKSRGSRARAEAAQGKEKKEK